MNKKVGRPLRYSPKILKQVQSLAIEGKTIEEMANELSISVKTFYEWKNKYKEFSEAIKKGKEVSDDKVEESLFKRAIGYEYEETEQVMSSGKSKKDKDDKNIKIRKTTKHVPPDVLAQMYWLKNRRPDKWRDKQDMHFSGEIETTIILGGNKEDWE